MSLLARLSTLLVLPTPAVLTVFQSGFLIAVRPLASLLLSLLPSPFVSQTIH
jgi:hypothetical protein